VITNKYNFKNVDEKDILQLEYEIDCILRDFLISMKDVQKRFPKADLNIDEKELSKLENEILNSKHKSKN